MPAKACTVCGITKDLADFSRNKNMPSGLQYSCRACRSAERRAKYASDPLFAAAVRDRTRQYRLDNPDANRNFLLKRKYGIDVDAYESLLEKQGGGCAICGSSSPRTSGKINLCVDHDHATGDVRGLLCNPCNRSIGMFEDDPKRLRRAADYVERGGAIQYGAGGEVIDVTKGPYVPNFVNQQTGD